MFDSFQYLREPLWLYLALLPMALLGVSILAHRFSANQYSEARFKHWVVSAHSLEQKSKYRQIIFTHLAWVAFAFALAGPRLPEKIHDDSQEFYQEVMLVLDLSLSMSARDKLPSRIERAKLEIFDLITRMQNVRLGVVVYAARPHLLTPFTFDKQVLRHYVKPLRTRLLPTEGSDTLKALSFSIQQFSDAKTTPRAIILISDGESHLTATQNQTRLSQLSNQLKEKDIKLYTMGIGTNQGAALLSGQSGWLEADNQAVVSRLQRKALQELAKLGNGLYTDIRDDDGDWRTVYDQGIATLRFATDDKEINDLILWDEYYSPFVLLAILALLIALWPSLSIGRRAIKPMRLQSKHHLGLLFSFCLLFSLLSSHLSPAYADDFEQRYKQAHEQLLNGDRQLAQEGFAQIPGFKARFAEASAAYLLEKYKQAIPIFIQATLDANTEQQRINSIFNLANCHYKLEHYKQASALYQDVLRYRANHHAANVNLGYAQSFVEELTKRYPKAKRAGSGPRGVDAPDNLDVSKSKISLSDSESDNKSILQLQDDNQINEKKSSGLLDSTLASEKVIQQKDTVWTYDISDLTLLQQTAPRIQVDEALIWQRLFEVEENFEAAQDQPNVLPGVKPW